MVLLPCCAWCDWSKVYNPIIGTYYTWQCAVHGVMFKLWPGDSNVLGKVLTTEQFNTLLETLSAGVRGANE